MNDFGAKRISDELILAARIMLVVLFVIFGWAKLNSPRWWRSPLREALGERLLLPPFLESRCAEIERGLKPI